MDITSFWTFLIVISSVFAAELPRFIELPESVIAKPLGKVILKCAAEPSTATIRWIHNGQFITTNEDEGVIITGGTLLIKAFKHSKHDKPHVGTYHCVADSPMGSIVSPPVEIRKSHIKKFPHPVSQSHVNASIGNVALIPCRPPGSDPEPLIWFEKDGNKLELTSRHLILPSGNLQIRDVDEEDQGRYVCQAENMVVGKRRTSHNKIRLNTFVPYRNKQAEIVTAPQGKVAVVEGSNITLECVADGNPIPVVSWSKYGDSLPIGRYHQIYGNLQIVNILPRDSGTYVCAAENGLGPAAAKLTEITVLEPPKITRAPTGVSLVVGATVSFECLAVGRPIPKISWYHNAVPVVEDDFTVITATTVTIYDVTKDHAGIYQCFAENRVGNAYASVVLKIRSTDDPVDEAQQAIAPDQSSRGWDINPDREARKPVITIGPSGMKVGPGQMVTLLCMTEGAKQINWLKDGSPIDTSETQRYIISNTGTLNIERTEGSDSADYTCVASNEYGVVEATAKLVVDVPEGAAKNTGPSQIPPTEKTEVIVPSATTLTLPASDNGTAPTKSALKADHDLFGSDNNDDEKIPLPLDTTEVTTKSAFPFPFFEQTTKAEVEPKQEVATTAANVWRDFNENSRNRDRDRDRDREEKKKKKKQKAASATLR